MKSIRCKKCGRQLMRGEIKQIKIKCPKCGHTQVFNGEQKNLDKDLEKALR